MSKKTTQNRYWGEEQEDAVIQYLNTKNEDEKNKIFNEYLKEPLVTMVESIIRRYKLYRKDIDFMDIHTDTTSFLMTKVDKFNPDKKTKAYSYFGTICKNYLMGMIQKDTKESNRSISYDDISSSIEDDADFSYTLDDKVIDHRGVIDDMVMAIELVIETKPLSNEEKKLGYALIEIFKNFDTIFQCGNGNKFNKNLILLSIREMTSLSTKEIRQSMRKYKTIYGGMINTILDT
jgi:hypothetical protein